jgi:hypothetical protein
LLKVVLGWDPMLQEFFCQIRGGDADEAAYEGLMVPMKTFDELSCALLQYKLNVPPLVIQTLKEDRSLNVANVIRTFAPDGSLLGEDRLD